MSAAGSALCCHTSKQNYPGKDVKCCEGRGGKGAEECFSLPFYLLNEKGGSSTGRCLSCYRWCVCGL